jgi:hypothetical protein
MAAAIVQCTGHVDKTSRNTQYSAHDGGAMKWISVGGPRTAELLAA